MADRRKLQGEIDRCLKKVAEGVETFEDIWQKVHNATNTNQKEKYEADLKKEIKKLQRLRDQIKTWLASSEIKDKRMLVDNRKLIETQMERFKVVERETKTKAYSKEGLGAVQKLDPIQKEKDDVNNWLSSSIDTLSVQVDQFESEIEALQIGQKKSKKDREKLERIEDLKNRVEKHRYHIKQLETLMRMLDNETVTVDQIKKIKDDIEYYIESSQDDDFQDNEYIYDELDMEDMKAFRANNVVDSTAAAAAALAKSSSTSSATKPGDPTTPPVAATNSNSSNTPSVENDDCNAHSNDSSTNDSPAASPGLVNSHSNNNGNSSSSSNSNSSSNNNNGTAKTSSTTPNACSQTTEFTFTSVNVSTPTVTPLTCSTPPAATAAVAAVSVVNLVPPVSKAIWSNSVPTNQAVRGASNQTVSQTISSSATSAPYATAVTSSATSSVKVLQANELLNDTRVQAPNPSSTASAHDPAVNHHPSASTVVTLYSAAAAAASSSVTSTATVSNSPWSNTVSSSNSTDVSTHQMLSSRQLPANGANTPMQLTAQQQMLLQQQGGHLLNGFKTLPSVEPPGLKPLTQQNVSAGVMEDHLDGSVMNALNLTLGNMSIASNNNANVVNSLNSVNHLSELPNSVPNASSSLALHGHDHTNLFVKNNLLIHQQNSPLPMQATNPPTVSSVSPSNNLNSTSNVGLASQLNNNFASNISTVDTSAAAAAAVAAASSAVAVNSMVNNVMVNSSSQNQSQNYFPLNCGPMQSKGALPSKLLYQVHLLESAFRHPIIPLDSHRLKPLTRMAPTVTTPLPIAVFPNQILPQFDSLEFYQRLAPETLFFIFYYMEGTKAQYMAAKTLKNQSWRFHTKCMMWFQRLEEPKLITEEYEQVRTGANKHQTGGWFGTQAALLPSGGNNEPDFPLQGTYIYFDFERWQQRKKEGFIFEYRFLEDKDLN